ncbi:MAG: M81 family metallopeptidase [Chthoniobacterales bacterium]
MATTTQQKRILLAGLFHETNTFAPGHMALKDFSVSRGQELFSKEGDGSPLGAFLQEAKLHNWEIIPTIDMRGTPGAAATKDVADLFFKEFFASAASSEAKNLDAIFLVLHGAMVVPGILDVEGELLSRIRKDANLSDLPIFGVLDLHGNITPVMTENSNALLAYRENPHTDGAETGVRAARLMQETFETGARLQSHYVKTDIVWPATGTATAAAPMKTLEAMAREEERAGVKAINVFAGFAHADTPDTGVSFTIVYDPREVSNERLSTLSAKFQEATEAQKELGLPKEWPLEAALDDALSKNLYPTCLVEPADNIGGGTPGDGTAILRMLLLKKVSAAGVVINDPETVAYLQDKTIGSTHDLRVGGKTFSGDPGPVSFKAKLIRLTDGNYVLEDRHSHAATMGGVNIAMGPCAVVESEGITILLTSLRSAPMDLGQWRSQGVDPSSLSIIGVKAAVAHRQAYDPITKASYWVQTPGPCTSNLQSLSYKNIRRPVFPLDPVSKN